jgi:NitT/TauT family transport system permease protein
VTSVVWPVATVAAVLLAWELWVRVGDVPPYVMAPFSDVIDAALSRWDVLFSEAWVTLREALFGYLTAVGVGVPLALAIDASHRVEEAVSPFLVASQVIPLIAIAPAMILWFGFGLLTKVLTVALFGIFVIVLETVAGLRSLQLEKVYLARSMGTTPLSFFLKIKIPNALPSIFGGLKLAAMFSVTGAVVAEFIASDRGLGHYVLYANSNLDTISLASGILYLVGMGVTVFFTMHSLERVAIPWHVSRRLERVGTL